MDLNNIFDTIIVGSGPSAIGAAYKLLLNNKSIVLVSRSDILKNYTAIDEVIDLPYGEINGAEFVESIKNKLNSFNTFNFIKDEVIYLEYKRGLILVHLEDRSVICGKSLLIATGKEIEQFDANFNSIYYSIPDNLEIIKNKNIIVKGSDNYSVLSALKLSKVAKAVYICDNLLEMQCDKFLKEKVEKKKNIYWLANSEIKDYQHTKTGNLNSITLSTYETIKCTSIFYFLKTKINAEVFKTFCSKDENGYISSTIPGVFTTGACTNKDCNDLITGLSHGNLTAKEIINFLKK